MKDFQSLINVVGCLTKKNGDKVCTEFKEIELKHLAKNKKLLSTKDIEQVFPFTLHCLVANVEPDLLKSMLLQKIYFTLSF